MSKTISTLLFFSLLVIFGFSTHLKSPASTFLQIKSKCFMEVPGQESFNSTVKLAPEGQPAGYPLYLSQPNDCGQNEPDLVKVAGTDGLANWTMTKVNDNLNDTYYMSLNRRNCPSNFLVASANCDDSYVDLKPNDGNCADMARVWKFTAVAKRTNFFVISSVERTHNNCSKTVLHTGFNDSTILLNEKDQLTGREEWGVDGYPPQPIISLLNKLIPGKKTTK